MLKILDIGSHIGNRIYNHIHSRFTDVVNFYGHDEISLSLTHKKIGGGPFNIVVDKFDYTTIESIEIANDFVIINSEKINILDFPKTNYFLPKIESDCILTNLNLFEKILLSNGSEKSLVVLLDDSRIKYFSSTLEKTLLKRYFEAFHLYKTNNVELCVKTFKGLGFGLTPSGDDFNAGILMGLNVIQSIHQNNNVKKINCIFELAKGTNCISNLLLYICKTSLCTEKFREVLNALSGSNELMINQAVNDYLLFGETSGADFLTGFYLTLKKYYDN